MSESPSDPGSALMELYQTVRRLRAPGGCAWDREQTHASLAPCLIEECSELLEAIDRGDAELTREELGDVLLTLFMLGVISEEGKDFTLAEAAAEVNGKMIRRHPHVFGDRDEGLSSEAVLRQWDSIKRDEKGGGGGPDTPFKELPPRLPATLYAADVIKRMRRAGWSSPLASSGEGAASVTDEASAGEALFAAVAACRERGIDPEGALRRYTDRVRESAGPGSGA
jgi:uncharacterized protein YabN with tetrapyrrole methylase and pyrophosphatase domain